MMEPMKVVIVNSDSNLVPVRLVVPDFLPRNGETARRMVNDIDESDYCTEAWLLDDEWESKEIQAALKLMDWEKVKVLEYDWEEVDQWGEKRYDFFQIWIEVADTKIRVKSLEALICDDPSNAYRYAASLARQMWNDWTLEEVIRNPCWMFHYAKNVCRGRLPEVLDNAMTMKSFEEPDHYWIKRYFGTKKYRKRNNKALAQIPWAA